jgi:hypothetical protein
VNTNKIDLLVAAGGTVKSGSGDYAYKITMPSGIEHFFELGDWEAAEYKNFSFLRYIDATSE